MNINLENKKPEFEESSDEEKPKRKRIIQILLMICY